MAELLNSYSLPRAGPSSRERLLQGHRGRGSTGVASSPREPPSLLALGSSNQDLGPHQEPEEVTSKWPTRMAKACIRAEHAESSWFMKDRSLSRE